MESNPNNDTQGRKKRSFIATLFSGDVPLPITYWVFGMLAGLFVTGLFIAIEANYAQLIALPFGGPLIRAVFLLGLTYAVFIWIAIWRSAGKFEGSKGWATAARIMVVLSAMRTFGQLASQIM